jgi:DNA-binding response OmpR family regulator
MRRIPVVDDDVHIRLAIRAWLMRYGFRVAMADGGPTRYLHKPFRPATLLRVIDECLSEAEPPRRHAATLGAVASALSGSKDGTIRSNETREGVLTG